MFETRYWKIILKEFSHSKLKMSEKILDSIKENKLQILLFSLIIGFTLYVYFSYKKREEEERIEENYINSLEIMRNAADNNEHLRNLYRNMHNLEAVERIEIAQNKGLSAGGGHNINQEKYLGEQIFNEGSRLRKAAMEEIEDNRLPYVPQHPSPIGDTFDGCHFGDCQINMDYNERILGIPSTPGSYHGYYN
jgi:Ca2+/Na+ antiporter